MSQVVEVVQANLDNVETLKAALHGANIIFSVTNYWEPFFDSECRKRAPESGISCRRFAYDVELQ
jgi:ornithine cyclodeaminase/alanine dehydrogenase-like protein (mu-crystallin family)